MSKKILANFLLKSGAYWGYLRFLSFISRAYFTLTKPKRVRVVDEDWDYLIILDACRYDYFQKYIYKFLNNGKLEKKISLGSCTYEWLVKNFYEYYDDIIYVSANPFISNINFKGFKATNHFFKVVPVWSYCWDEETGTVHPQKVAEFVLSVKDKFPDKRIIAHFLQPHAPYIGSTRISQKEICLKDMTNKEDTINRIWEMVRKGEIPISKLKKAYVDNLELVLGVVKKLVCNLDGKIVITSDHGECFGELFVFGHPHSVYIKELVEIPWFVIEKNNKYMNINKEKEKIRKHVIKLKNLGKL